MRMRSYLSRVAMVLTLIAASSLLFGQSGLSPAAANILSPPEGAKVAVVVFEDLECPQCARTAPIVLEAERKYSIPVIRYNYPLPQHNWAMDAAIMAEYFESKSPKLGVEFREYIFQNQPKITRWNLHRIADEFAQKHDTPLPFLLDPQGKLLAVVQHDKAMGDLVGVTYTPTVYVVSKNNRVEVTDPSQLFHIIEQVRASAGS
jgi:protein-disulfide isomerase